MVAAGLKAQKKQTNKKNALSQRKRTVSIDFLLFSSYQLGIKINTAVDKLKKSFSRYSRPYGLFTNTNSPSF